MKTNDEIVNQEIDDWLEPLAVTIETDDGEFLAVDIDLIKVPLRAMKDKWERAIAVNAMAIALYWLEEDGRPKHLVQDLWGVRNISVLDHIDKEWKEKAEGHFTELTKENKG